MAHTCKTVAEKARVSVGTSQLHSRYCALLGILMFNLSGLVAYTLLTFIIVTHLFSIFILKK